MKRIRGDDHCYEIIEEKEYDLFSRRDDTHTRSEDTRDDDDITFDYIKTKKRNRELDFTLKEQKETRRDAINFVKYLCSEELFNNLDMNSIDNLEGHGDESDLRMETTRIITNHIYDVTNKSIGNMLYRKENVSSLYSSVSSNNDIKSHGKRKRNDIEDAGNRHSEDGREYVNKRNKSICKERDLDHGE